MWLNVEITVPNIQVPDDLTKREYEDHLVDVLKAGFKFIGFPDITILDLTVLDD